MQRSTIEMGKGHRVTIMDTPHLPLLNPHNPHNPLNDFIGGVSIINFVAPTLLKLV